MASSRPLIPLYLALLIPMLLPGCSDESLPAGPGGDALDRGEAYPGGQTTNFLLFGRDAFTQPLQNLSLEHEAAFATGNTLFNQNWVTAPASVTSRDGLGPVFNARSCSACHFKDGRAPPPNPDDEDSASLLIRLSIPGEDAQGNPLPDPVYGGQLQPLAILGVPGEGSVVIEYEEQPGEYGDGSPYSLRAPTYRFEDLAFGELHPDLMSSPRIAPQMIGLGLLEAITDLRLEELSDPDDEDGNGISGRINRVWDADAGKMGVGRFGWKAGEPNVLQQSAGAFFGDIGITSRFAMEDNCTGPQLECQDAYGVNDPEPELRTDLLEKVGFYGRTLAVPAREFWDEPEVQQGKALFMEAGCAGCHVQEHRTGDYPEIEELSDQRIFPYTDLLLHDMGEGLSDGRPVHMASAREWRTPPLWGIGMIERVNRHQFFMHDGRARGFAEAILWHGGEAEMSRENFRTMDEENRNLLIRFLESL